MQTEEIQKKLTAILQDVFDDDELEATPKLTAADVDGWDSLNHVRLIVTVERAFGVKFAAAEVTALKNVGELIELIRTKTRQ